MATIDVEIHTEDESEAAICRAYWKLADDGETFAQPLTHIKAEHDVTQNQVTKILAGCTASSPDLTCPECQWPYVLKNRTHFGELLRTGGTRCKTCQDAIDEAKRVAAAEEQQRRTREVATQYAVKDDGSDLEPEWLSLSQAVALHAMLSDPAVEQTGMTTPIKQWPKDRPWVLDQLRIDLIRELTNHDGLSLLKAHPASSPDAFWWEDGELKGWYLTSASYYLIGSGAPASRATTMVSKLTKVFREGPWPAHWLTEWPELWDRLALAEASAYLDLKLAEHRLDMKQGDGTRAALEDALATFSLGQVYNVIFRAARDSAAYYQKGGVNIRQAANSTVGRITGSVGRARANKWDLTPFRRDWSIPMSAVCETFFTTVMWVPDMMTVARKDAFPPQHAVAQPSDAVAESAWPEPSDDDISDCTQCGRQFYGTGLCPECSNPEPAA